MDFLADYKAPLQRLEVALFYLSAVDVVRPQEAHWIMSL